LTNDEVDEKAKAEYEAKREENNVGQRRGVCCQLARLEAKKEAKGGV
jgi:hypothetical protein